MCCSIFALASDCVNVHVSLWSVIDSLLLWLGSFCFIKLSLSVQISNPDSFLFSNHICVNVIFKMLFNNKIFYLIAVRVYHQLNMTLRLL